MIKSGQDSVKNIVNTATKAVQTGFTLAAGAAAFKGMLGRGKAGAAMREKAASDAAYAKENALRQHKSEEEANAIADKEYQNSLAKSKENMRKQSFSFFGGNLAKKYYEGKSALKDLYKPDKEQEEAVKSERLKRKAAFELDQSEEKYENKRNAIKTRQSQLAQEAEEKAAQEKAAKDAAKRAAIIAGIDSGDLKTSALNEVKIRTGAKYRPVLPTKQKIGKDLKKTGEAIGKGLHKVGESFEQIGEIPTMYHTSRMNAIKEKAYKQQEKIVRAKDAITKGMDADKAQKVIEKSSDKVDNLLKKFEKHGKKIDKHLAKKK